MSTNIQTIVTSLKGEVLATLSPNAERYATVILVVAIGCYNGATFDRVRWNILAELFNEFDGVEAVVYDLTVGGES